MKKSKQTLSLRRQMMLVILLCWLLPVLMVLSVVGGHLSDTVGTGAKKSLSGQFELHLQVCADRVNSAVEASRLASYDPTIRDAWRAYQEEPAYASLYRNTLTFLNRQYGSDSRFLYSAFWFSEDPENMNLTALTGITGTVYTQANRFWSEDFEAAKELAAGLDTAVGFLEQEGRVYLVRNLLDSSYETIGVLVLRLNLPYYFEELSNLSWASDLDIKLGGMDFLLLRGEEIGTDSDVLSVNTQGNGYKLSARASLDYKVLLAPLTSYIYVLLGMAALLIPLLLIALRFLRRRVTYPIEVLMGGAEEIEQGKLGYQLSYEANSREFQYLTDSFNRMSGQLSNQFNRLYQEELALRDAQIKALQSHINPHFLNNTLEIINWEARMSGDIKVSKMIEALSTVLDAALDRRRNPEVRLAEEMIYVNAYLYIISERFGKRLNVSIDLPAELMDYHVPRLILQPVIENAVEHGIGPVGHGTVALRGYLEEQYLILEIENGGGLSPEDEAHISRLLAPDYDMRQETSGNIGIANVNQRLHILYGDECGLSIFRREGDLVIARLKIAVIVPSHQSSTTNSNSNYSNAERSIV